MTFLSVHKSIAQLYFMFSVLDKLFRNNGVIVTYLSWEKLYSKYVSEMKLNS
jgi:hypothetical protein